MSSQFSSLTVYVEAVKEEGEEGEGIEGGVEDGGQGGGRGRKD